MSRIVAKTEMTYEEYKIVARVYKTEGRWFNVVAILYVDGKRHAIRRDASQGLYWARRTMAEMLIDIHGNY